MLILIWLLVACNAVELCLLIKCRHVRAELKPNHGTSARDVLDRVEGTANRIERAAEAAVVVAESAQATVDRLSTTISIAAEIAVQNQARLADLAGSASDAAAAASLVADDLAASHRAGDANGAPGAAAVAAGQSPRTSC